MFKVNLKIGSIALLMLCQLLLSNLGIAQNTVVGVVQDTSGRPLRAVSIRLVSDKDTLNQITNDLGRYQFDNVKGNVLYLTFNILGYKVGYQSLFVLKDKSNVEVPKTLLEPQSFVLKDVYIVKVLPIVMKQDTIQFNFDAYKFRQNSLLEEAIKNLPGFTVSRDGAVYYNGQPIRKAQVNNKDFFGGDLLTATKNLPAGFIQNLQVIDSYGKVDETTGIKDGDSEKIINITLKPDKTQIYFGQVTLGGGTNERYLGSFGLNKFNDGQEVSIIGSTNNTNTNMLYLGGLGGSNRQKSLLDIGDYADPVDGLNKVSSIGINLSDQLNKILSYTASYSFVRQQNVTDGFSQLTSSYVGNTIRRKEDYILKTNDKTHNFKFGLTGKFANKDELKVSGHLNFNNQMVYNTKNTELTSAQTSNKGIFKDSTEFVSPNGELEVFYSKHFQHSKRKLVGEFNFRSNNLARNETVHETYLEIGNQGGDRSTYRQNSLIDQHNVTNSAQLSLTYIEPFLEKGRFEFNYMFDITGIDAIRRVYDRLGGNPIFIDSLAVNYEYMFRNNRFGIYYHYDFNNRLKFNIGFAAEPIRLEGRLLLEDTDYAYENINLMPTANLWYRFSKDLDWQIDYRGKNNQPNFTQIAPVVDNSNSRSIVIGNPELKAETSHRISTRIRKTVPSRAQYLETNFAYNMIMNKIVSDKTSLERSTIQETTFRNSSGYYDIRWFYIFNTPFITDELQLDLTGNTDYFNNPSFIDDRKRITKQLLLNQSMQLKYAWSDYFESGLVANYNLNNARYDIPFKTNISVHTLQMGVSTKTYVGDDFSFGAEASQRINDGYANSFMNSNQTVINGFVEFTFLPNKQGMLRLQGFDLLDQNKNMGFYSEYIGNDVYEARNNRLGRYFMLSLNLRLQKLPKK